MRKEKWPRRGILLTAVILYLWAIFFCRAAKEEVSLTYIRLSQSIDAARAEEIFAQEALLENPVGFCFWGEVTAQRVTCKETGAAAEMTQVLLSGNPEILGSGVLSWQNGCFLDDVTAEKLFGTAHCGEQMVWQEDVPYRVLGTISTLQPTMLTVAAKKEGAVLNRCALSVAAEQSEQIASQFLMRWGLQGERISFYPLWVAVHNFLLILPGSLLLRSLGYGIKNLRVQVRGKRLIFLLAEAGLLVLLCRQIIILPDMLPSRWSDFSFWGTWLEGQKENLHLVLLTPMGERHLQMMLNMVKSILSSTAAFFLAVWTRRRRPYADPAD